MNRCIVPGCGLPVVFVLCDSASEIGESSNDWLYVCDAGHRCDACIPDVEETDAVCALIEMGDELDCLSSGRRSVA